MMERDCYNILGVARTASSREIRDAFVRLVKRHHPDASGAMPQRLRDVQRAYRCLSDPNARAAHDRALAEAERRHSAQQRRIRRRLHRYDRRHSHAAPSTHRRVGWRSLLMVAAGVAIVARLSLSLIG